MSVVRVVVVDPEPVNPADDIIVFQVPENGRAHKLLTSLLDKAGIQNVTMEAPKPKRRRKSDAPA